MPRRDHVAGALESGSVSVLLNLSGILGVFSGRPPNCRAACPAGKWQLTPAHQPDPTLWVSTTLFSFRTSPPPPLLPPSSLRPRRPPARGHLKRSPLVSPRRDLFISLVSPWLGSRSPDRVEDPLHAWQIRTSRSRSTITPLLLRMHRFVTLSAPPTSPRAGIRTTRVRASRQAPTRARWSATSGMALVYTSQRVMVPRWQFSGMVSARVTFLTFPSTL